MPMYEYTCDDCGERFEQWQSFQDEPIQVCPNCGKRSVRKLFSSTGIIFKGSGWYVTDSRKFSPPSSESKSDSKSNSDGSETKTETKPDPPASETKNTQ